MKNKIRKKINAGIVSSMLIFSLFLALIFLAAPSVSAADWYDEGYSYCKLITIDNTKVAGDLGNFPVLVSFTNETMYLETQYNTSNGWDIIFVNYDNTTQYHHEIDDHTSGGGSMTYVAWVNVTSISGSVDTKFWMYYGNSSVNSDPSTPNTWDSDYGAVYHMNDGATTNDLYDSTANRNNGTGSIDGRIIEVTNQTVIGNSYWFTGAEVDDLYITVPTAASISPTDAITISTWFRMHDNSPESAPNAILGKRSGEVGYTFNRVGGNKTRLYTGASSMSTAVETTNATTCNVWYQLTCTYDEATDLGTSFWNGTQDNSNSLVDQIGPANVALFIGSKHDMSQNWYGWLDELRISSIARNESWITTNYNNQFAPDTFLTVGEGVEPPGPNADPVNSVPSPTAGATGVALNPTLQITINDGDGHTMNQSFWTNATGSWGRIGSNNNSANATVSNSTSVFTSYSTKYWWNSTVEDGNGGEDADTYNFTTEVAPDWYEWADGWTISTAYACSSTGYLYGNWSESEHFVNDALDNEWTYSNASVWDIESNAGWWDGNYTFTFDATNSNHGIAIMNSSGTNRSQEMGWTAISYTGEPTDDVYSYVIFAFENASSFDFVMFRALEAYLCNWNGTNITEISTGYTYTDNFGLWTDLWTEKWDYYYPEDAAGVFWKLIYNEFCGELQFKVWGPTFYNEPTGWMFETQSDDIKYTLCKCHGVGVWNPNKVSAEVYFDLMNLWQLNYTTNTSATMTTPSETVARPHMAFPVVNLSQWADYSDYLDNIEDGNLSADSVRDVMLNLTNQLNLESRAYNPASLETKDQNDTIYYYSAVYDNVQNFTELVDEVNHTYPSWLADEYLYLHVQMCADGELDESGFDPCYDDTIIGIDVDNNGIWEDNDRIFWFGSDGLRMQYNGLVEVEPNFNATISLTNNNSVWNMHRYITHVNHRFLLPITELVKNDGKPLNASDVFGLCIVTIDDIAADDNIVVWNNWNETACVPYYSEDTGIDQMIWFLNYSAGGVGSYFLINNTTLTHWGEGVITGEGDMSEALSYRWNVTKTANVSSVNNSEAAAGVLVNYSIYINNTGTGTIADININETFYNCSCNDWKFTLVSTNANMSNLTFYNDSCYFSYDPEDISSSTSVHLWFVINVTQCTDVTGSTLTNYANVTGNFVEPAGANVAITWGTSPDAPSSSLDTLIDTIMPLIQLLIFVVILVGFVGGIGTALKKFR